jgi:nucleotide-binding universal stress UspA family protein
MPDAAVTAADTVRPDAARAERPISAAPTADGGDFRVMVPLSNPRTETDLITLGSAVAKQRGGTVHAVHIVQVPDQTPLEQGAKQTERIDAESGKLLEQAREDAESFGVPVETHTVLSHRSFEEIFDAARTLDADQVVMGWGPHSHGRAESRVDELTQDIPCDFLVLKDRGFDPSHVLLPTAGGPDSVLGAEVVRLLRNEFDSRVTLLHALSDGESYEEGERFLKEWAVETGLEDAETIVDDRDVETAISDAATDATLLVIGATERGLLSRLVDQALVIDVLDDVECSVLLAETARERTLRERLLGIKDKF